jgi:hypothetical protein
MVTPLRSGRAYLILMSLSISIAISCNVELALSISCKKIDTKIGMKIDIVEQALSISVSIFDSIEQPLSISIAISILKIDTVERPLNQKSPKLYPMILNQDARRVI